MLISEVRKHLEDTIIPFWHQLRDDENGGYYGYMNFNLEIDQQAVKGCILNSRILWFFSNAYAVLHQEALLEEARHAYQFMKDYCIDYQFGGVYWMVDYKGNVIESMKHTYNQAFAIYALSAYYQVSKEQEALDYALGIFHRIENTCKDAYGYLEAFDRQWQPIDNRKLCDNKHMIEEGKIAEKTMNTILHILEAYTELYRVSEDREVKQALEKLLETIPEKVYNSKRQQLEVFFDNQLESLVDMHSYGHDIEAAWLIDRAAEALGDSVLIERTYGYTKEIAYKVMAVAYTPMGVLNERFNDQIDTTRIWWVQAESLVGFINAYEKTKDSVFIEAAVHMWDYIKNYMIDTRGQGEWYWRVNEKGEPDQEAPIVEPWKCPYHNGRMCIEVIRRGIDV